MLSSARHPSHRNRRSTSSARVTPRLVNKGPRRVAREGAALGTPHCFLDSLEYVERRALYRIALIRQGPLAKLGNLGIGLEPEPWRVFVNLLANVLFRYVPVMLFHHSRIAVAQIPGYHEQRRAVLKCQGCPGVA